MNRTMPLTRHQQAVYNQIRTFLDAEGAGVFILKGYAGTGKTFLLQYLANELTQKKKIFTLLASTGRAASVLRAKTEFTATTIHSELYKFRDVDGDDENIPDDAPTEQYGQMKLMFKHNGKNFEILLCLDTLHSAQGNLNQEQQKILMIDFARKMRKKGIKRKSEQYRDALRSDVYLNSLRSSFGYAVTCHKSQGGEWKNVFLFLQKGMYIMGTNNLIRWWYTGITRAKESLYITDDWWIG